MQGGRNAPLRDTFSNSWAAENAFFDIYEARAPHKPRFQRGRQLARSLESGTAGQPFTIDTAAAAVPGGAPEPRGNLSSLGSPRQLEKVGSVPSTTEVWKFKEAGQLFVAVSQSDRLAAMATLCPFGSQH